jgi:hypothetical protein
MLGVTEGQPVVIARHLSFRTGPSHVLRPSRTAVASLEGQPVIIARHLNLRTGPSPVLRPPRTACSH